MSPKLKKIYPTIKKPKAGILYVTYTCNCVFDDKKDQKRKKRSVFEIRNGKRTNRVFCPNHPEDSFLKNRFKICPSCKNTVVVSRLTTIGPCPECMKKINQEKKKVPVKKTCYQYGGEKYELRKNEKVENKPLCGNRSYCLSFIKSATDLLQCKGCSHFFNEFMKD